MGQARNSGRNASLDQKKVRAAGRQQEARAPKGDLPLAASRSQKTTGGASGSGGRVRSRVKGSALTKGGGGGGAANSLPKD